MEPILNTNQNLDMKDKPTKGIGKQPKFGVLRVLGDINKVDSTSTNNAVELWKQDQYVHDLQFERVKKDYPSTMPPNLDDYLPFDSRTLFQKLTKKGLDEYLEACETERLAYEADLSEYNKQIEAIDTDNEVIEIFRSVKKENNYTCSFCGFRDRRYIEIHHINGDHFDNSKKNLETACTLCHRQHHLFWLSLSNHASLGIQDNNYITQVELNIMQRIAFVLEHHPNKEFRESMGINGKLGELFNDLKNKFSRPIHASLMTNSNKNQLRQIYIGREPLVSSVTNKSAQYNTIKDALMILEKKNHNDKELSILKSFDEFINSASKKDGVDIDEFRQNNRASVVAEVNKYEQKLEKTLTDAFTEDTKFTVFELAMALKDIPYDVYEKFKPNSLFLLYNSSIFSKEQIDYYLELPEFNPLNWGEVK